MKITQVTAGSIGTNCYIIYNEATKSAVVIDPSDEAVLAEARIEALGLDVKAVLLTHGHFDHSGEAGKLADKLGVPIWMHPADKALPSWLTHGLPQTRDLADGETLDFDGLRFTVIHTPGHTPGSVCFRCGDSLFAGDTLFAGSCGRTDLPGGSSKDMAASLRRLAAMEGDCTVYPGHGETSTLSAEREGNPYVQMAMEQQ